MSSKSVEKAKQFSGVFLPELHAVEARRRRYRIEQLLGFLPPIPPELPPPEEALEPLESESAIVVTDTDQKTLMADLEKQQKATDEARQKLEEARRRARAPSPTHEESDAPPSAGSARESLAAARQFLAAASLWHATARHYRDLMFERAAASLQTPTSERSESETKARNEWEQAETIFTAAAQALAAAVKEVGTETLNEPSELDQLPAPPAEPQQEVSLSRAYARILSCENAIRAVLDTYLQADPDSRLPAYEKLCELQFYLARAEQRLFERASKLLEEAETRASCARAAVASGQGVQRASREWNQIRMDRLDAGRTPPGGSPPPTDGGPTPPPAPPNDGVHPDVSDDLLRDARQEALAQDLVGVALSGGGIRSATFALGVLQGLAQLRLLGMIDYLSTVSGGGYIGGWFAAWVQREGSLANVERQLSPNRVSQAQAHRVGLPPFQPLNDEPEPIHHLRAYSRYLSPRFGPFSADTWTLLTAYLRNLFVNALFILPLALAVVFLWRVFLHGYDAPLRADVLGVPAAETWDWQSVGRLLLTLAFVGAFLVGTIFLFREEEMLFEADLADQNRERKAEHLKSTHWGILFMLLLMALTGSWLFSIDPTNAAHDEISYNNAHLLRYFGQPWVEHYYSLPGIEQLPHALQVISLFAVAFLLAVLVISSGVRTYFWLQRRTKTGRRTPWNWKGVVANVVFAACFGVALYGVLAAVIWPLSYHAAHDKRPELLCLLHTLGMPLIFGAMVVGGFGNMALIGPYLTEYEREWRARLGAYLLMGATAWLVIGAAALYLPWLVETFYLWLVPAGTLDNTNVKYVWGGLNAVLGVVWGAISGGGAWAVSRGAASETSRPPAWWVRPLMFIAPAVFLLGLLAGVSSAGQVLLEWFNDAPATASFLTRVTLFPECNWLLILAGVLLTVLFGAVISVNRFSLHMIYANRLTRCYLGASRRKRVGSLGAPTGVPTTQPIRQRNLFTGFDPLDDFPLAALRTVGGTAPYVGPLPLINVALNCLAGNELAYQDRRADSFVMTPEKCGGRLTGYANTPAAGKTAQNLTVGRVMTISGAAVDPNMSGLSPPLTALMTLFNTRLGWWLANPRPDVRPPHDRPTWEATEPGFGWPLLWEFLGLTNEERDYVHLSDGGHFENLGVYELIRRRCRFLLVIDAGIDRTAASDNMAIMQELVRTDFGVTIELDPGRMQLKDATGYSEWHCVIGRIRYDEVDESAVPGVLVYIQATMTGDEPADLLQYVTRHPAFPRQSTLDQFFDETQFECYRALGHHSALQVFGEAAMSWTGRAKTPEHHRDEVQAVFAHVRQQWFPPPPCTETAWLTAAQLALQLEQQFTVASNLTTFHLAVYPELRQAVAAHPPLLTRGVQEFRAVSQMLQVMEVAWSAMKLDAYHAHPLNRGWVDTFYRWTACPAFRQYWPFLRAEYSKPFVDFCEGILNLQPTRVDPLREPVPAPVNPQPLPVNSQQRKWVNDLDNQFRAEWADQFAALSLPPAAFAATRYIADLVAQPRSGRLNQPFVWYLRQGAQADTGTDYCCGIVCAGPSLRQRLLEPRSRSLGEEAELLVWLRGAYRTLGIGREVMRPILKIIQEESAYHDPAGVVPPLRRLTVFYPLESGGPGGRLVRERWLNFFFDHDFRRIPQSDKGIDAKFAILKHELSR